MTNNSNNDLVSFLVSLEASFKGPLYKKLIGRIRETTAVRRSCFQGLKSWVFFWQKAGNIFRA